MRELMVDHPLFVGFKIDSRLRHHLASDAQATKQYVSDRNSTFLTICHVGEDRYIGKVVDKLSTDQIEDIQRNIVSIVRKIGDQIRAPNTLLIVACSPTDIETVEIRASTA